MSAEDHDGRERLAMNCVHPPIALDRLHYNPQTRQAAYDCKNHDRNRGSDSATSATGPALDFLAALCTQIPDAGQQLLSTGVRNYDDVCAERGGLGC